MKWVAYVMIISMSFSLMLSDSTGELQLDPTTLSLEEFYTVKPFRGKTPRMLQFSENDHYLSFLWNRYGEFGYDLYVYDLGENVLKRVTSILTMKEFDPPEDYEKFLKKMKLKKDEEHKLQEIFFAQRDFLMGEDIDLSKFEKEEIEKLKKELEKEKKEKEKKEKEEKEKEEKKKGKDTQESVSEDKKKSEESVEQDQKNKKDKKDKKDKEDKELETWELRDKLKEKKEKDRVKPKDLYPGVSNYKWSKKADELIFVYRGDLFRYFPSSGKIHRLTMTDEQENIISYTPEGDGYYYSKGNEVFRVFFNSSYIHQINHKFTEDEKVEKKEDKDKLKITRTSIAPDGEWMLLIASKRKGKPARKNVNIISYKKRFAETTTVKRQMPDDKRNEPEYRFYLRQIQEMNYGKQPDPIFEIPGGDIWYEFSNINWAKDGSKYSIMTWEREKEDLKIWVGEAAANKKPELLFEMKEEIGFKHFYYNNLKFTPDGKFLAAVLNNEAGFRQPVIFDLETKKKREVIKGEFESYPILDFSKDGKFMFVVSDVQDPAMHSVYRVNVHTGEMTRIGKPGGMHRRSSVSHNSQWVATNFGNWDMRPELYLIKTADSTEKILTDSHKKDWEQFNFIKPEMFKFKNRHGDTISAMIFKPARWTPEDKRPAIVYVYGGPLMTSHSVEADNFSTLSYLFQMIMAAKHGYVTVNIDPRGQSGYGRKFSEANYEHVGETQVEDLEDLVKHMETGFGVDTGKIGLHGWSFGGYQTLKTLFSSPDTFACGIAVASVTEWENYNSWYAGSTVDKSVRGKPTLRKYSLLPLAKNLKKPLLLVHGMMDPNVLYQDTLKVYQALLEAGKETLVDLFLDPEGKHGLNGIIKNKAVYKKFESWFLDHLGEYKK